MKIDDTVRKQVIEDSRYVEQVVASLVNPHLKAIDEIVSSIKSQLKQDVVLTDEQLANMIMVLSTELYDTSAARLATVIREEIAEIKLKSDYAFAKATAEGRVADKEWAAIEMTQDITILHLIYTQANKLAREKVDRANEVLLSLKKILSYRIEQKEDVQ